MLRLSKLVASTALGLTISFSLFTPGAFAQSINQNTTNQPLVSQAAPGPENTEQGVNNNYNNPSWNNYRQDNYNNGRDNNYRGWGNNGRDNNYRGWGNNGQNNYRHVYQHCGRVSRWVRNRFGWHRVWYRVCRWY